MRIPLDYYRILGLPIQASTEQLQQAYRDRTLQLPRREYSEAAIAARKQLIEEAYAVLVNPEQRVNYDADYLMRNFDVELDDPQAATLDEHRETVLGSIDSHAPSIEITDDQFVGALLILQELGEYELVLQLARPYLNSKGTGLATKGQQPASGEPDLIQADIILTVALACLELGREQWQQGQYENAAAPLETGQELLLRQGVFPNVRGEIQADLYKLRPYRILELLTRSPENSTKERLQGLKLLQSLLQERGGIDGTGNDGSGLSIDDFLRFIQQLRSYLTAAEQQSLFEAESQRPSAVATYLAVYALIARGFTQRQPSLIRQAKLLLMRLGKRQDVHLEQAVCALLLGQTEAASRALELSQEYEPLAFIRENSQGSPDLLPGLCLYGERWLQTEVFPHFRDLSEQQSSLKDYFADEQVQAYLEALPAEAELVNQWTAEVHHSFTHPQATTKSRVREPDLTSGSRLNFWHEQPGQDTFRNGPAHQHSSHTSNEAQEADAIGSTLGRSRTTTATLSATPDPSDAILQTVERTAGADPHQDGTNSRNATALVRVRQPQRGRRRSRSQSATSNDGNSTGTITRRSLGVKRTRLVLLTLATIMGLLVLGFLLIKAYGWLKQTLNPGPSLQKEQPLLRLNEPPIPIPDAKTELLEPAGPMTQQTAEEVIQSWLSTKAVAFGPEHGVDKLEQILVNPALAQWQQTAKKNQEDNQYRHYKHSLKVDNVQTSPTNPDKAQVEANVNEAAEVYEGGKLKTDASYQDQLHVRYNLVRKDGKWRIREMTLLK